MQKLYTKNGAREFWVHNTPPVGCRPYNILYYPSLNLDVNGCIKSHNEVVREFNKQLREKVYQLRTQLSDAHLTYVDILLQLNIL